MEAEVLIKYVVDRVSETKPKRIWIMVEVLMICSSMTAAIIPSTRLRIAQAVISLVYLFELFRIATDIWMMRLS
jgi:hypothetical protein